MYQATVLEKETVLTAFSPFIRKEFERVSAAAVASAGKVQSAIRAPWLNDAPVAAGVLKAGETL
jgi:hypothetical protein